MDDEELGADRRELSVPAVPRAEQWDEIDDERAHEDNDEPPDDAVDDADGHHSPLLGTMPRDGRMPRLPPADQAYVTWFVREIEKMKQGKPNALEPRGRSARGRPIPGRDCSLTADVLLVLQQMEVLRPPAVGEHRVSLDRKSSAQGKTRSS